MDLDIGKPKIDLREQPTITCEKCDGMFFREVTILKRVSRLLTGGPHDTDVPFPVYMCDSCGHVNKDQNPFMEDEV
jgi:predicted nucleic acid-binding Zn ribbon protein